MRKSRYSLAQLQAAVAAACSGRQTLTMLGMAPQGGNYAVMMRKIRVQGLSIAHWTGQATRTSNRHKPVMSLEQILVINSTYSSSNCLKKRLLLAGHFVHKCYRCGLTAWQSVPIPLELEHINGIHNDNRIENITLLCPNCHALTPTYRGRNQKRKGTHKSTREQYFCICGHPKSRAAVRCIECHRHAPKVAQRKVIRPTAHILQKMLWQLPTTAIAEQFGVSDKAVAKWATAYQLQKPARGYWTKQKVGSGA